MYILHPVGLCVLGYVSVKWSGLPPCVLMDTIEITCIIAYMKIFYHDTGGLIRVVCHQGSTVFNVNNNHNQDNTK